MSHTDYRILLDRGRKAGLSTGELYRALATLPPSTADGAGGRTDSNGYVSTYDSQGHSTRQSRKGPRPA